MGKICTEIKFFDYLENYHKKVNTITKNSWKTIDNIIISSSYPSLETIIIEHKWSVMKASPFKLSNENTEIKSHWTK